MQGGRGLMALAMAALVVITMAEEEKKRETSEKSWMETDGMVVGVIVSVVAGGIGGWILLRGGGKKKVRGDAVFLVGACDAGKTVLVQRMREEGGEKGVRSTHTSMMLNECVIQLEGEEKGKGVRVIDYPGHGRLRPMLFDMLEDCAVLIFVIDATTFHLQARELAEFMLDLLTSTSLLKHARTMLVACNKTDALPDELAGISPKVMVKKRLESEIEALRVARADALNDTANTMRVELEIAGGEFKWSDSPLDVEFADCSALEGKISPIVSFLKKAINS